MRRSNIMDAENMAPLQRLNRTSSDIRKVNKPLMEKRRRERINHCLDQLKALLMEVTKKENSFYSKLEKADILELTVKYLKNQKRQTVSGSAVSDTMIAASKYTAGFLQCTTEVDQYLGTVDGMTPELRSTLLGHLTNSLRKSGRFTATSIKRPSTPPQSAAAVAPSPVANTVYTLGPVGGCSSVSGQLPIQLVPAQLPTGDVVYLLANPQSFAGFVQQATSDSLGVSVRLQNSTTGSRYETCVVSTTAPSSDHEIISPATSPTKQKLKSEATASTGFDTCQTNSQMPSRVAFETCEDQSLYQPTRLMASSMTSSVPKFCVTEMLSETDNIRYRSASVDGGYRMNDVGGDVNNNVMDNEMVWRPW